MSDIFASDLIEGSIAYMPPWLIFESQGKFYIPGELSLAPEVRGTCELSVTRQNGLLVIGEDYHKPSRVNFDWHQLQECVEVVLPNG